MTAPRRRPQSGEKHLVSTSAAVTATTPAFTHSRTPCRWGHRAPIPPWNDQVLQVLRGQGRVQETAFDMLAPGVYTLCVSVGSPQGTPEIALPLPHGTNRRYPLGKVTVTR